MVTRLLLLAAFLLGLIPPPTDGHAEHCAAPAAMVATGAGHHDHGGAPDHEMPAEQEEEDRCPPRDCAMAVHCVQVLGEPETASSTPIPQRTSHLALRTVSSLVGRHLEPPTPPPNRSL